MGKKLTELTQAITVASSDLIGVVVNPSTSPESKKAMVGTLFTKRNLTDNDAWNAKGDLIVGTGSDSAATLTVGSNNQSIVVDSARGTSLKWVDNRFGLNVVLGDGYNVVSTGVKMMLEMPFAGTIQAIRLLADVSGSITIDIWRDVYSNYPPTVADSIVGGGTKPSITSASKAEITSFSGWSTVNFAQGDIFTINVDSCSTIKQVTLAISGIKTF